MLGAQADACTPTITGQRDGRADQSPSLGDVAPCSEMHARGAQSHNTPSYHSGSRALNAPSYRSGSKALNAPSYRSGSKALNAPSYRSGSKALNAPS